ncbi:division/outer membrane stress-associated lipid-binding lipoprotein [Paraferrimonas sedimenticola]|uniref:BON domain-containing protein n=1 Tax=Paraferrimonas sedimenticola TaxID=375674 RepID=A0AA37RYA8_9GAMM|nr:division/outer membrane stress-associated lipid-binding lipoprotein [Paraferrimonas sedimenticola]GLP97515.1 BON domain-containing protein [Paraferrimonas sedimenticola]
MNQWQRLVAVGLVLAGLQGCAGAVMVGAVGGAMMLNDERSIGTQLDDTNIERKLSSALSKHDDLANQTNISAVSINRSVLLIGQAPNSMLRDKAITTVKQAGVSDRIHSQIRIGNPISFTTRSNDTWITTKVKSRIMNDPEIDVTRIKVITENGEVFLLGLISKPDAERAVEIARNTSGVRKVVKVFEYTQS